MHNCLATPDEPDPTASPQGAFMLFYVAAAVVCLWGLLLPWLGQRAAIANHIELQRHHGIDPSAMYYSELETLPPIVHRLEKLHMTNHAELWGR